MGASQSSDKGNTLHLAMANLRSGGSDSNTYFGGSDSNTYFGGATDADPAKGLREYEVSLSAKAKEDVIRKLARALKAADMKVDPEGDLDEIVKTLVKILPHPSKNRSFGDKEDVHVKVCKVIARVLNDQYSPGATKPEQMIIDTTLSPAAICSQVSEWAHSFAAGVNTEFLAVHASVRNALRNIEVLSQVMAELYAKIRAKTDASGDGKLARELGPLQEVYDRAQSERQRQEEMLKNVLNVQLAPAAKELEIAMQDESKEHALIKKLGLKPGTSEFGDSLAMAVSGLGTAASIAARVHRALKQVGLSVRQYLDSKEFTDFQRLLDAKIESGSIKADDLAAFLTAMATLRSNFDSRATPAVREAIESPPTAASSSTADVAYGGEGPPSAIDKRVKKIETEKTVIVRDFVGRMSRHYDEILAAIKALGPELGKRIPVTEKTDALRDALIRLRDMRGARQELAFIGYYADASSRERKESFISSLRMISQACSTLMELDMYREGSTHFARLKAAIDALEKTVDYFSDVIAKKFGGGEDCSDEDAKTGGAIVETDLLPEIARSSLSLNEAVNEFNYFYYVARVRANLDQSSKELEAFGEGYTETLGDAVAIRMYTVRLEKANLEKFFDSIKAEDRAAGKAASGGAAAVPAGKYFAEFPPTDAGNAKLAKAKEFANRAYEAKEKLYRALQAVDLYMKAFTVGIASDPDAVRSIKKMLDGTEVIARWYTEDTGTHLWRAFERMGSTDFSNNRAPADAGAEALKGAAGTHYYDHVGAALASKKAPSFGVPQIGIDADEGAAVQESITKCLEFFQALKNLVNGFARIGSKFGGEDLNKKVFMGAPQIYKALWDYMRLSALSINTGKLATDVTAGKPTSLSAAVNGVDAGSSSSMIDAVGPFQVYFGSVQAATAGSFAIEDQYFSIIIKAMAAKILTTLGVFDMFERRTPLYALTPTRMIIGGARGGEEDPEVDAAAAELYFRLPRLVEFYRSMLRWSGKDEPMKIAMLPEVEGTFSGLIRLVFMKMMSPESGDYSDSELRGVIREVNAIHAHFRSKDGERATRAAINGLVMEVNRRYGIIKSADMLNYWKMVERSSPGSQYEGRYNDTNYAILPDEDQTESDRRAPSDRFMLPGTGSAASTGPLGELADRTPLDENLFAKTSRRMMLRAFRADLEKKFKFDGNEQLFGSDSFSLLIKQAEGEMRRAGAKEAKLAVAMKLIQGTNVVNLDANKAFMFHETVVVGLNTLSALYSMIRGFSDRINALSSWNIEVSIGNLLNTMLAAAVKAGAAGATTVTTASIVTKSEFAPYILTAMSGQALKSRGGINYTVSAADLYTFISNEMKVAAGANVAVEQAAVKYTDEEIKSLGATSAKARFIRATRIFTRLVVDCGKLMRDFIENVFDFVSSSSGLVELRFPQTAVGVQLNMSKLRSLAESLLSDVKFYIDGFRPFISQEDLKRFESGGEKGSVFWLEKNLVDVHFRGGDGSQLAQELTLEGISRRAGQVFKYLTQDTSVALPPNALPADFTDATKNKALVDASAPTAGNAESRHETYGCTLSGLVWYDAAEPNSGQTGLALSSARDNYDLGVLMATDRRTRDGGRDSVKNDAGTVLARYPIYTSADGTTRYRSLMFAFNQLLSRYLSVSTDPAGSRKIYVTLLNAYANGVAARAVASPSGATTHPDMATGAVNFGKRGDPATGAVLLESLAYVIQRLVKDVNATTQVSDHLVSTLTDVPLYVKESLRVNLPGLVRLFELIVQKGEFIKQLIQKTQINCARPTTGPAGDYINDAGTSYTPSAAVPFAKGALNGLQPLGPAKSSADMKVRLVEVIDAVDNGAYTLASSATEVLKELGDTPAYLQTQDGSIEMYKMRYNRMPLMPLSATLFFLGDLKNIGASGYDDGKLFPRFSLGEPEFKVQYGVRGLLVRQGPVEFDRMPGVKAALDAYNGVSAKREQVDPSRYLSFVRNAVTALRYVTEARNYKSSLSTSRHVFSFGSLVDRTNTGSTTESILLFDPARAGNRGSSAYAVGKVAQDVVTLVESSNQEEEMSKIVAVVGAATGGQSRSRDREIIANIIDMNIIPINVHALMRGTPLANSYNYEYTFEQMVASFYGENASWYTERAQRDADMETVRTRQLFIRLLVNPYLDLDATTSKLGLKLYGSDSVNLGTAGFVHRIFRGDNDLGLGRPKFLSDGVFNMSLFGSVYPSRLDFDEAGPGVGSGVARGRSGPTTVPPDISASSLTGGDTITYLAPTAESGKGVETAVKVVNVGSSQTKKQLEAIGRARFDTRFVRNLFFITNVLRIVRAKLSRELTASRSVLVSSHSAVAPGITEYGADPFGPNEVFGSTLPPYNKDGEGLNRFSDKDRF